MAIAEIEKEALKNKDCEISRMAELMGILDSGRYSGPDERISLESELMSLLIKNSKRK